MRVSRWKSYEGPCPYIQRQSLPVVRSIGASPFSSSSSSSSSASSPSSSSSSSSSSSPSSELPLFGDEKMLSIGSMPCSSRTPVSRRVTPVFLEDNAVSTRVYVLVCLSPAPPRMSVILVLPSAFAKLVDVLAGLRRAPAGAPWGCHCGDTVRLSGSFLDFVVLIVEGGGGETGARLCRVTNTRQKTGGGS